MTSTTLSGEKKAISIPSYAWVILGVTYLTGLVAPMTKMKIPPVMPILIGAFNLSYTQAGWLQSFFSISGVLLAFPAGFIMQKIGVKRTGLLAVGSIFMGSILGGISNSAGLLLLSRFIEGAGYGFFAVVGPAALAIWFPTQTARNRYGDMEHIRTGRLFDHP